MKKNCGKFYRKNATKGSMAKLRQKTREKEKSNKNPLIHYWIDKFRDYWKKYARVDHKYFSYFSLEELLRKHLSKG